VLIGMVFKLPPADFSVGSVKLEKKKILSELTTKEMLKNPKFYGLWLCYTVGTLIGLMIIGITSPVGEEIVGLDPKFTASLVSFFAIFNAVGRPLFGWITDKIFPRKASFISYLMAITASFFMIITGGNNLTLYIISFSLFWLILGSWLAIAPASTVILFGEKNYRQNYGIVFTAYGFGAILGGIISGILRDIWGSYFYVFHVIIGLGIIGMLIAGILLKED
jgi:MFS family permease